MKAKHRASVKFVFWLLFFVVGVLGTISVLLIHDHVTAAGKLGLITAIWGIWLGIAALVIYG